MGRSTSCMKKREKEKKRKREKEKNRKIEKTVRKSRCRRSHYEFGFMD